jgi:acetoin:2,6-dichlorophenolindophenol oxidoreductase subunit alpha
MPMDAWSVYSLMKKSRLFEEAVTQLWNEGLISGEMHLGTGEEAILAGIVSQLDPGDAMALDHRGTSAFLMRGVDPVSLLRELLGRTDGLCGGRGGHMHLFSRQHMAASSGIVGAAGPTAVGFALASECLRPGTIAVAFFGEGAVDQGMLMESIHLAAEWQLPVLFVCKDDGWAITTPTGPSIHNGLADRVRGLGARYTAVDGLDVEPLWRAAQEAIEWARSGNGPAFLHARCVHLEGHFLGLLLLRIARNPLREFPAIAGPLVRAFLSPGGGTLRERLAGLRIVLRANLATLRDPRRQPSNDPLVRARNALLSDPARLHELDAQLHDEVAAIVAAGRRKAAA